jgi:carbonic anhydrase
VLHGVWMLLFITMLGSMVGLVPLTVLAGLLVFVGAKLVNPHHIQELRRRGELPVYLVTVGGVVGINLLAGIALGLGLAVARLLWKLGRVQVDVAKAGDVHQVRVSGALTFVGVPKLSAALAAVPVGAQVELDLAVDTLDHSGYEALESWCQTHKKTGGKVWMESLEEVWTRKSGTTPPRPAAVIAAASPVTNTLSSEGAR